MATGIKVPRLDKGKGFKGPDFYGCMNTGTAPAIFHSRTGKYVVGPEMAARDAMQAGACLLNKRTFGKGRQKVYIFKGRGPAVSKFLVLCGGADSGKRASPRPEHMETARKARAGDIGAAIALGDY